jgi:arsenate reductase
LIQISTGQPSTSSGRPSVTCSSSAYDVANSAFGCPAEAGLHELARDDAHRVDWLQAMVTHPVLIQRPIITADDGTTVVGRSEEAVRSVLP